MVAPQLKAIYGAQIARHSSGSNREHLQLGTINTVGLALGKAGTPPWYARSVSTDIDNCLQISTSPYTLQYLYQVRVETPPCFREWFWGLRLHDATHDWCDLQRNKATKKASLFVHGIAVISREGGQISHHPPKNGIIVSHYLVQLHMFGNFGDLFLLILHSKSRETPASEPQTIHLSFWLCSDSQRGTNSSHRHEGQGPGSGWQRRFSGTDYCANS